MNAKLTSLRLVPLFGLCLALCAPLAALTEQEVREGFRPLFDSKDLSDWEGDERIWSYENGVIIGQTDDGARRLDAHTFLIFKNEVPNDFVLRFDFRITKEGNSGIQYRSFRTPEEGNPYRVSGYQADIDGRAEYTGMIYGENFRWSVAERGYFNRIEPGRKITTLLYTDSEKLKEAINIEDWNTYEVIAVGYTFIQRINGQMMSVLVDDDTENRRERGLIAIQAHAGPPMRVEFNNMRIKEVK